MIEQREDWRLTEAIGHELGRGDPFAAAIRGTRMPMVITDPRQADNPIVFANQAFQTLTGYGRQEIIGRNCRFLQGPNTDPAAVKSIRQAIERGEDMQIDILNYRKDGATFWNALYLSPVRGEDGAIQFFFASQLDVTDRINAKALIEEQVQRRTVDLQAALEAKTLLLHEVDHRVKNNLTMIGSLLRLQARSLSDPTLAGTLDSMLERVNALATVHRRLYQSEDITKFDVGALAETLVTDVVASTGRTNITVSADVDSIEVPSSHASAVGLIINELLTNAVKHAYADGRGGALSVSAKARDGRATIVVEDDGPGISAEAIAPGGLGMTLINRLSRQVNARTDWVTKAKGTRAIIDFPLEGDAR
jgi:PAS domain S-box-containing protein